jgi:threo-3-hydroxy-L-aspartate ammonia-lyase
MSANSLPIDIDDVREAAARLAGVVTRTPVMTSRRLNERLGLEVFFKCENLQRAGAFKMRGAYNAIVQLDEETRRRGVVAASSGNHAQGVALSARILGIPATICMPSDAPQSKRDATAGYGAEVVEYDRLKERPDAITARIAEERGGLAIIPPFDHAHVMAGQGTLVLELWEEVGELDALVVPLGGGGLLSGCATAAKGMNPNCRVVGVEPEGADDWVQSLAAGERVLIDPPATIADGVRTRLPGELPWLQVQALVDDVVLVSDEEIKEALRYLVMRMKLVVEPSGALAPAAVFEERVGIAKGSRVGVVISGGNVDADVLCSILNEG